jgi:hypothetical protein
MHVLNNDEVNYVSGAGLRSTVATGATVAAGAQLGSYLTAARFGATLGAAAGPIGAIAGAMITTAVCYYWNSKYQSE